MTQLPFFRSIAVDLALIFVTSSATSQSPATFYIHILDDERLELLWRRYCALSVNSYFPHTYPRRVECNILHPVSIHLSIYIYTLVKLTQF